MRYKSWILCLMVLLFVFANIGSGVAASGVLYYSGVGFHYFTTAGKTEVVISGINSYEYSGVLNVPAYIEGLPVTSICGGFLTSEAVHVIIPPTLREIGPEAFVQARMESIVLPASLETVDDYAFYECYNLKDVYYQSTEEQWKAISIGESNYWLTEANIHFNTSYDNSVYETDDWLLYCDIANGELMVSIYSARASVTGIVLPQAVDELPIKRIGNNAFYAAQLDEIMLPPSISTIDSFAFGNSAIQTITLSEGLKKIDENAFYGCANLTEVYFPGTKRAWNTVEIGAGNEALLNATIHYTDEMSFEDDEITILTHTSKALVVIGTYGVVDNYTLKWASSAPEIVQVTEDGKIIALQAGSAIITATSKDDDTNSITCSVYVPEIEFATSSPTASITNLSYSQGWYAQGAGYKIGFTISAQGGTSPYRFIYYVYRYGNLYTSGSSSSSGNMTVFSTSKFPEGKYTIEMKVTDQKGAIACARCKSSLTITSTTTRIADTESEYVNIRKITGVQFPKDTIYLDVGEIEENYPAVYGDSGVTKSLVWQITDESVVSLISPGEIEAINYGATWVTATSVNNPNASDSVLVIVSGDWIVLPSSLTTIEDEAFEGTIFTCVRLPNSCNIIGSRAFANSQIRLIEIPDSVSSIADDAFYGDSVGILCHADSYASKYAQTHGLLWFEK